MSVIQVRMVTGDNIETAKAIALECGILDANSVISEPVVIEGKVFREMSESARGDAADKIIVTLSLCLTSCLVLSFTLPILSF